MRSATIAFENSKYCNLSPSGKMFNMREIFNDDELRNIQF